MSWSLDFAAISVASFEKVSCRESSVRSTSMPSVFPWPALYSSTTFDIASPSGPGQSTIFTVPLPPPCWPASSEAPPPPPPPTPPVLGAHAVRARARAPAVAIPINFFT